MDGEHGGSVAAARVAQAAYGLVGAAGASVTKPMRLRPAFCTIADQLGHAPVGHAPCRRAAALRSSGSSCAASSTRCVEGRGVERLVAEVELALRVERHAMNCGASLGCAAVGLGQVELQARGHQRRGDHEDHQQHQHHVDQRRHVDVAHRLRRRRCVRGVRRPSVSSAAPGGGVASTASRAGRARSLRARPRRRRPACRRCCRPARPGIATARPAAVITSASPTGPETRSIVIVPAAEMLTSAW